MTKRQKPVSPYLATLRRLPDDVVLSMATREYEMNSGTRCVCGWALREDLLAVTGDEHESYGWADRMAERFGGTDEEWDAVFYGVIPRRHDHACGGHIRDIETAFVDRVVEAVARAEKGEA